MTGAVGTVAKQPKKPGKKPSSEGPRTDLIAIKCWPEYKEWVIRYAKRHRTTPSQLIDSVLARCAELDGFEPPPER